MLNKSKTHFHRLSDKQFDFLGRKKNCFEYTKTQSCADATKK